MTVPSLKVDCMSKSVKHGINQTICGTQLSEYYRTQNYHLQSFPTSSFHSQLFQILFLSSISIEQDEQFLRTGNYPVLAISSAGHALHVFVNGEYAGRMAATWLGSERDENFLGNLTLFVFPLAFRECLWQSQQSKGLI